MRTIEKKFIKEIDKFLIKTYPQKEQSATIKPSSYYGCIRKTWYGILKYKARKRSFARGIRILECGTQLHEWIQTQVLMPIMEDSKSKIKKIPLEEIPSYGKKGVEFIKEHNAPDMEIKVRDSRYTEEYPISAMVDGAFEFEGKKMLFEFKTINPTDFEYLYRPLPDHIKQGALYTLCFEIPRVLFLYYNKGNQDLRAFLVEYTEEQIAWAGERAQEIEEYLLDQKLPPREENKYCTYCEYKHLCQENKK